MIWLYFKLSRGINRTNVLTKFQEDQTINVASGVFTRQNSSCVQSTIYINRCHNNDKSARKTQRTDLFCAAHYIIRTNVLTNLYEEVLTRINSPPPGGHIHEDWTINVSFREKCPAPWRPYLQATRSIFELPQDIVGTNLLTKFHDDWTINVAYRVLTRFTYSIIRKNVPPSGSLAFQPTGTDFELTINVALRVLTRQMLTSYDGQKVITKAHHEHIVLR
ncbi:hypothetical protein DPMN_087657 [Dreissena polymorpha]|uniref:Uncharacterized protein n=1 Tax=Dreissena polymorpha TaxID=45954 RepID=A0A9D4KSR9_DREPO|nr:hypothetical protein DPMN_087657 [Dreissena polymorpha]